MQLTLLQKWVPQPLFSNRRRWPMSRDHLASRPARGSSRCPMESRICAVFPPGRSVRPMLPVKSVSPGDQQLERSEVQADRPLRMSRCVDHLRRKSREPHLSALSKRFIRQSHLRRRHAQPSRLLLHHLQLKHIVFVQVDRRARQPLELEPPRPRDRCGRA